MLPSVLYSTKKSTFSNPIPIHCSKPVSVPSLESAGNKSKARIQDAFHAAALGSSWELPTPYTTQLLSQGVRQWFESDSRPRAFVLVKGGITATDLKNFPRHMVIPIGTEYMEFIVY